MGNLVDKLRSHFDFSGHPKNRSELPSRARFSIWHVLFAMLLFSCLLPFLFSRKVDSIPYSQFKQNIAQGIVDKLIIGPENIEGTLTGSTAQEFTTAREGSRPGKGTG